MDEVFGFDRATAAEIRELQARLRGIKRVFRQKALMGFQRKGTWDEKWKAWNRLFPDLAFPSPGAIRKAIAYEKKKMHA